MTAGHCMCGRKAAFLSGTATHDHALPDLMGGSDESLSQANNMCGQVGGRACQAYSSMHGRDAGQGCCMGACYPLTIGMQTSNAHALVAALRTCAHTWPRQQHVMDISGCLPGPPIHAMQRGALVSSTMYSDLAPTWIIGPQTGNSNAHQCMLHRPRPCTMRFGSTAKALGKCKLKYYRRSECHALCIPVQPHQ